MALTLDQLPPELLDHILSFLPPEILTSKACFTLSCETILHKLGTEHWMKISKVEVPPKANTATMTAQTHQNVLHITVESSAGKETRLMSSKQRVRSSTAC